MKRILLIALVLAVVAGIWFVRNNTHLTRSAPPAFYGNVDIREARLGFRVSGKILEVLKEEGDAVQAGETLARLDDEPFRNALAQSEAQVRSLTARLEELRNGNRAEEIEQARKSLAAAESTEQNAALLLQRQKQLVGVSATPRQEFDNAESAWRKAVAQREAAQAQLNLLNAGTRAEQIHQAEANLAAAEANLAQTRTQLEDARLTAPESGVILTRSVEPGSIVSAGSTALTVSLGSPAWIRAYVTEPQLGLVHPGRDVLIMTDSRTEPYHGQVGDVSPRAEFTPKSVETEELRTALVYRFRVIIRDADQGLRQGMPVTIRLQGDSSGPRNTTGDALPAFDLTPRTAEAASALREYRFHVVRELRMELPAPQAAATERP